MKIIIFAILAILLLGCTEQKAEAQAPIEKAPEIPQPERVSTANITVTREVTNVLTADTKFPEPPKFNFSKTTADGRLIAYYFFSPHCEASVAIRPEIDRLESKYPEVDWKEYDITTQNGTMAYVQFAERYNLSAEKRLVPQVLVNGTIITDRFNINESLEGIIQSFEGAG
jgi:thiol-disulfide isomerase/thioredoxin